MMKNLLKRCSIAVVLALLLVIFSPFLVILIGPEPLATSARILLNVAIGYGINSPDIEVLKQRLQLPEGYSLSVYADGLGRVRFMHPTEQGGLLVSRPSRGDILLLQRDADDDGQADGQRILVNGLIKPHGIDVADGWLYIAESNAVGKIRFNPIEERVEGDYSRIVSGLSDNGSHWTKTVRSGPDNWLYLTTGSSCNVCEEEDGYRAAMLRFDSDGNGLEIFATGLRNSVGFDWSPWDHSIFATDNGRDLLGDDFPPCELNKIEAGGFYGWPYINGSGVMDPDMGMGREDLLDTAISPVHEFRAHNAPLGITFIRHSKDPNLQRSALVALHGSWNRSQRDGYKVVSLNWQPDGSIIEKDFLSGFKGDTDVIGRPVDIVENDDGELFISDDYSGRIYRIEYSAVDSARLVPRK